MTWSISMRTGLRRPLAITSWLMLPAFADSGLSPGSSASNDGAVVLPPAGRPLTFMRSTQPSDDVVLCAVHGLASSPMHW